MHVYTHTYIYIYMKSFFPAQKGDKHHSQKWVSIVNSHDVACVMEKSFSYMSYILIKCLNILMKNASPKHNR